MPVTYVSNSTVVNGNAPTVAVPANCTKNDLLLIISQGTGNPSSVPAGWTQLSFSPSGRRISVMYKFATTTETSVALSGLGTTGRTVMMCYRGAGGVEIDAATTIGTSNTATPSAPTTTYSNDRIINIYAVNNVSTTWSANAQTAQRVNSSGTTTLGGLLIADESIASAGPTTARAATLSVSASWSTFSIGLIESGRNLYWVGGTGVWQSAYPANTAPWSNSTGGSGGVVSPSLLDNVFIDDASGGAGSAITLSGSSELGRPACQNLTVTSTQGVDITGTGTLNLNGNLTLSSQTLWTNTGTLTTVGTGTIATNGVTLASPITFNGPGQTFTLGSAVTTTGLATLTAGSFNLSGFDLTCLQFNSDNTNTRALTFGSNWINITSTASATVVAMAQANNLTVPVTNTGGLKLTGSTGNRIVNLGTAGGGITSTPNLWVAAGDVGTTVDLVVNSNVRDLIFTGFSGTTTPPTTLNIRGNLRLVSDMSWVTGLGIINFISPAGTRTIDLAGKTLRQTSFARDISTTPTWQLLSAWNSTNTMTITGGRIDLNGFDMTTLRITFGAGNIARGIDFGANFVNLTDVSTSITLIELATATSVSFTGAGGFRVTGNTASGAVQSINAGNTTGGSQTTAPNIWITAGQATISIPTGSHIRTLDFTGFSGTFGPPVSLFLYGDLVASPTMNWVTGTGNINFQATTSVNINMNGKSLYNINLNGTGGTWTLQNQLTVNNTLTLSRSNFVLNGFDVNTQVMSSDTTSARSIAFGNNYINVAATSGNVISMATVTNFSPSGTGGFKLTGTPSVGTRTIILGYFAGGAEATSANVWVAGGTPGSTVTFTTASRVHDLKFTGFSGTWSMGASINSVYVYGDFTLDPSMTVVTNNGTIQFQSTSSQTITSAGKTLYRADLGGFGGGGSWTLQDALTLSDQLTLGVGNFASFDANGQNVTVQQLIISGSTTRSLIMGSGTWSLTGTGAVISIADTTGLTVNSGTSTIVLSNNTAADRTFNGYGFTWYNLVLDGPGNNSGLTITGNNTFNTISSTKVLGTTIILPAGGTTTVNNWTATGSASGLLFITSSTPGTQSTLTKTGGGTITGLDYLDIRDSNATPANTWYAGSNSTNTSNNTGWTFSSGPTPPPAGGGGNFLMLFV